MPVRVFLFAGLALLAVLPQAAEARVRVLHPAAAARGQDATLTVAVGPAARCSIEVVYESGPSKAAGLVPEAW